MSTSPEDTWRRSPAQLHRAARQHLRHQPAAQLPWLVPILYVPAGVDRADARDATLAQSFAESQGLPEGHALLPALHEAVLQQVRQLQDRGWARLPRSCWELAQHLSDAPGTAADPQFTFLAHAHAWDASRHPENAAPGLAHAVHALLSQPHLHQTQRAWRWPAQAGLVILAENTGVDLVRAALPLCPPGAVLAVYAAVGSCVQCVSDAAGKEPPHESAPSLHFRSTAELCSQVRRDIAQRLLRQPATQMGQDLQPWFADRVQRPNTQPSSGIKP